MRLPGPLTVDQAKQLGTIQNSAKHLLALINDLLDLARIEAGKLTLTLEAIDYREIVAEVVAGLRPLAEQKGLRLAVSQPEKPLNLQTDRRVLSQILINLVNNAIKFTDVGEVVVSVSRDDRRQTIDDRDNTIVHCLSSIVFSVRDTGIGILAEDQAKLFQEFGRIGSNTVSQRERTGLGLRLAQQLAEQLGGRITVQSEYGAGSTFTLILPEASGNIV
jgi:two-component system, sensor histidine kinase and response regulator